MIEIQGTYSRRQHWEIDVPQGTYRASKAETITGQKRNSHLKTHSTKLTCLQNMSGL
ncbi:MAG: hypothetical protein ABIF10_07160 [Candidatus Woesearchaeota archaeon]